MSLDFLLVPYINITYLALYRFFGSYPFSFVKIQNEKCRSTTLLL